jgi:hypothetical protein
MLSLRELFGDSIFEGALCKFQDSALEVYAEPSTTRVRIEQFPATRALYHDIQVRYNEGKEVLFTHMYEFLRI